MALFSPSRRLYGAGGRNFGVKLRVSLCDVLSYVSAQTLVFPRRKRGIRDLKEGVKSAFDP
jgi:hypothetical protein